MGRERGPEEELIQGGDQILFVGTGDGLHGVLSRWAPISTPKTPGADRMFRSSEEGIFLILNESGDFCKVTLEEEITPLEFRTSLSLRGEGGESVEIIEISSGVAHFLALSISGRVFSFDDDSGGRRGMDIWTTWPEQHPKPLDSSPSHSWGIVRM